jgi:antitoxin component YwqK of YwqJK toxin-antitoxin module
MNKQILYILTIVLIVFQSCDSKKDREITLKYENGEPKQVKEYPYGRSDSNNYNLIQYNKDGSVEMKGEIRNGKEEGTFIWYYPNGNKKWQETFKQGVSIDTIYCYYESGKLKRKNYPPDQGTRKAFEYYETGELKIISFISGGDFIDSNWTGFYKNGEIREIGQVENGRKVGIWKFYDIDSELTDSIDQTGESKVVFDFEEEEIKYKEEKSR